MNHTNILAWALRASAPGANSEYKKQARMMLECLVYDLDRMFPAIDDFRFTDHLGLNLTLED